MSHTIAAHTTSEQVAAAPPALSSGHFSASRLLAANNRVTAWSPPANTDQQQHYNGNGRATTAAKHYKARAELSDQGPPTNHERDRPGTTNGRRGWRRRVSSHELSLSPSSSSLDDDNDEDNDDDCDQGNEPEEDDQDQAADKTGGQPSGGSAGAKPHAGPMGIFFKVWSLVKVTKARHNKMKRQHSEDAGQMHHFDALGPDRSQPAANGEHSSLLNSTAAGHQQHQTHLMRQAHILQDGHFRRAGSQPPPSSHLAAPGRCATSGIQQTGDTTGAANLLQTSTTTGTNGSSSGVSSTTSSTIATSSYASGFDRPPATARRQRQPTASGGGGGGGSNNRGSWASRMKPRGPAVAATPAQQATKDRRQTGPASGNVSSTPIATETPAPAAGRLNGLGKQQQQQATSDSRRCQLRAHKSREPSKGRLVRENLSHLQGGRGVRRNSPSGDEDDWAVGDGAEEEEEDDDDEQGTLTDSENAEDDSDLNDIYSTPNDSIQSVPSGARLPETTTTTTTTSTSTSQPVNKRTQPVQMTKSFSVNNFNRLRLAQHHPKMNQHTVANQAIERIDENKILDPNGDDDEQQQQRVAKPSQRNSNGSSSRFFISSSSSEDSNTIQQQRQCSSSTSSVARNSQPVAMTAEQVSLSAAFHYHARPPPPTRPDSLLITSPIAPGQPNAARQQQQQQQQQAPNLMTPSALILGGPVSVAAMSPIFPLPASQGAQMFAVQPSCHLLLPKSSNYKKSPSLFEMSSEQSSNLTARFSSKYPYGVRQPLMPQTTAMSSFIGNGRQVVLAGTPERDPRQQQTHTGRRFGGVPHSISLHDCKLLTNAAAACEGGHKPEVASNTQDCKASEYKLAQMLLELGRSQDSTGAGGGGGLALKDQRGYTALMHAIISENLSAIKCLIEHGVDLNETNNEGLSALDLVCSKQVVGGGGGGDGDTCCLLPLEMLKLLIEHQVDLDRAREGDGSRLLDRLIGQHDSSTNDKLAYIDCLLHNGAKLGSATWAAASGKQAIQLRLLRKLCQDGYFLYKKSSIEAAVYRFEYALKRLAALEQQLDDQERRLMRRVGQHVPRPHLAPPAVRSPGDASTGTAADELNQARAAAQQVKYQTFLGLSRCERKRRFFKRALEFAHMSILVESTSYEGYYSKAHILKDLGELDDALLAIDQTERLVGRSIAHAEAQLCDLKNQQESIVFDGCFRVHEPQRARWIESSRAELANTLDYLQEAKKHIAWLRAEILDDKRRCSDAAN